MVKILSRDAKRSEKSFKFYSLSSHSGIACRKENYKATSAATVTDKQQLDMNASKNALVTNEKAKQIGLQRYKKPELKNVTEIRDHQRTAALSNSPRKQTYPHLNSSVNGKNTTKSRNVILKRSDEEPKRKYSQTTSTARRKSIDCAYQLQVWKFEGSETSSQHIPNGRRSSLITFNAKSSITDDQKEVSFPPLGMKNKSQSAVVINERAPTEQSSLSSRNGSSSGMRDGLLFCSEQQRNGAFSEESWQKARPRDKKSTSIDYGNMLLKRTLSPSYSGSAVSRNDFIPLNSLSSVSIQSNSLNVPTSTRTESPKRHSFESLTNHSHRYNVLPTNTVLSFINSSSRPPADKQAFRLLNEDGTRPMSGRFENKNYRSLSVYSPSSVSSVDKQSDRFLLKSGRRRASLPNTSMNLMSDTNKSPEFFKAINELVQESEPNIQIRISCEHQASSALSTSSMNSNKEPSVTILQRISEEIIQEAESQKPTPPKLEKGNDSNSIPTACNMQTKTFTNSKEDGRKTPDQNGVQSNGPVNEIEEIKSDATHQAEKHSAEMSKAPVSLPKQESDQFSHKKSLFHVPEPGLLIKKQTSMLKHTTEISRNEENRHFVYGMNDNNTENEANEESYNHIDDEDDDVIDIAILDEADEDICEEDFQNKRIIRWLLAVQVQTERNTEETVQEVATFTT